ncbi:MAG: PEP-CTERM sorting domain-containing protein [Limisphaerales bacterium]
MATALVICAIHAQGQSVNFNFSGGTPDGWTVGGFANTPAATVLNIGGQNYVNIALGGYQVANVNSGTVSGAPASSFNSTLLAALQNPANYQVTYNYYINTSTFTTPGTYLQLSSFVNAGSGFYGSPGTPSAYEPQLDGAQLASGNVFSGSVTIPFTAFGTDANAPTETYFRLGLILNGDGTGVTVNYSNIGISPVPEPSTLALAGLGLAGGSLLMLRRRHA